MVVLRDVIDQQFAQRFGLQNAHITAIRATNSIYTMCCNGANIDPAASRNAC